MINLAIRILVVVLFAIVIVVIFSLLDKDLFKGLEGKRLLLYLILLTVAIVGLCFISWGLLKDLNVNI